MSVQLTETNQKYCQQGLLEIDHICVCLPQLPSISRLQELGLVCNEPMLSYADRGTVSQVIFFCRMYLEFITVVDLGMAAQFARRTGLDFAARAQWQRSGASPFGIALRHRPEETTFVRTRRTPRSGGRDFGQLASLSLSFSNENLATQTDPFCFIVPESLALTVLIDHDAEGYRRRALHPLGLEELTGVMLQVESTEARSQPMQLLAETQVLTMEAGVSPLLELVFDDHQQHKRLDLRWLNVPLVLKF